MQTPSCYLCSLQPLLLFSTICGGYRIYGFISVLQTEAVLHGHAKEWHSVAMVTVSAGVCLCTCRRYSKTIWGVIIASWTDGDARFGTLLLIRSRERGINWNREVLLHLNPFLSPSNKY